MQQLTLFQEKQKVSKKQTDKGALESILDSLDIEYFKEYRFDSIRKFRFDYFIKIGITGLAIEYDGLNFKSPGRARHTNTLGFIKDCTKLNLATSKGYFILRYTTKHLQEPDMVKNEIIQAIKIIKRYQSNGK